MRIPRISRLALAVGTALLVVPVTACGGGSDSPAPAGGAGAAAAAPPAITVDLPRPDAVKFFNRFQMAGLIPVEFYTTLAQGARAATVGIVGEVVEVRQTRVVGKEANPVVMIGVVLRVAEVVTGELPTRFGDQVVVEFTGPTVDLTGKTDPVGALAKELPVGHQGLWFLRSMGERTLPGKPGMLPEPSSEDLNMWRVISPQGLFVQGANDVEAPLAEDMDGYRDMAAEGRDYDLVSELIAAVRPLA